jgi:tetratricopeptide (TPR) repeat protein
VIAAVLNAQGDAFFYQGDLKSAKNSYEQALKTATRAGDKDAALNSRLNLGMAAVYDGRSRSAINDLRALAQQADAQGRKYISVAASVLLAQAMIENKDYAAARQELGRTLGKSEKLTLRLENARIHFLLGKSLQLSGNSAEAATQYANATRLLEEIGKEQGAEHLAGRYDLKPVYAEITKSPK